MQWRFCLISQAFVLQAEIFSSPSAKLVLHNIHILIIFIHIVRNSQNHVLHTDKARPPVPEQSLRPDRLLRAFRSTGSYLAFSIHHAF